jgi:hypothetical protein
MIAYEYLKVPMLVRNDNCLQWLNDLGAAGWHVALSEGGYFVMERTRLTSGERMAAELVEAMAKEPEIPAEVS